jgi:acyl carrier protein
MSNHKDEIRAFIKDNFLIGPSGEALADDDSLIASQIVDSTGFLELVTYLEERFGIVVDDLEMIPENLDSVLALNAFVQRKQVP